MERSTVEIIVLSVFGVGWVLLFVLILVLSTRVRSLRRTMEEMQASGRLRVQKLTIKPDKNHAFHNPSIAPDEELSRRGYSMYSKPDNDIESGRGSERQTGGFVDDLHREFENRQQRSTAPPFLLQGIEENKRKSRTYNNSNNHNNNHNHNHNHKHNNNHYDNRQSDTNPNFIY